MLKPWGKDFQTANGSHFYLYIYLQNITRSKGKLCVIFQFQHEGTDSHDALITLLSHTELNEPHDWLPNDIHAQVLCLLFRPLNNCQCSYNTDTARLILCRTRSCCKSSSNPSDHGTRNAPVVSGTGTFKADSLCSVGWMLCGSGFLSGSMP